MIRERDGLEWLETDGRGGFASGTISGVRTRRYHALLLKAARPPALRFVLVNGFEAWVEKDGASFPITTQRYAPDVRHPDGETRIERFTHEPWPAWRFRIDAKTALDQEILIDAKTGATLVAWSLHAPRRKKPVTLVVRLLVSGRDFHALHRENRAFRFEDVSGPASGAAAAGSLHWRPYDGVPGICVSHDGDYEAAPLWYRHFLYAEEKDRGLDFVEDLASPGVFRFDLVKGAGRLLLEATKPEDEGGVAHGAESVDAFRARVSALRTGEKERRASFRKPQGRAAGAYLVGRGTGASILAGYPWFGDWGRDTFIAMRGLLLATGRLTDAKHVLLEWSGALSRGMMPNRFPDHGEEAEYNSVDASLWFVIATAEFLALAPSSDCVVSTSEERLLRSTVEAVVDAHAAGTRHRIGADEDGLLRAGEPGQQLTWMDARTDGFVVTPRIGKPVEVQALWLGALAVAADRAPSWKPLLERGRASFAKRFWNEDAGCLFDVVDVDHQPGVVDASIRPNQIFAVGGLPFALLEGDRARAVVDRVEKELWTPFGLRTLSPADAAYCGKYEGDAHSRDGAYHQGTVWPWLLGAFTEAWLRVRGGGAEAKREAEERFVAPLRLHLEDAGLGHVSEIFDGDPPHTPRGCPFQAWSVGELLRMELLVAPEPPPRRAAGPKTGVHRAKSSAA